MKTVPDQHVLKSRLRKALRARRTGIAATQRKKLDAAINRHLVEYAHAARLSDIAAYFAFDGEPDLRLGLALQSLHDGKRWVHEPLRLSVFIEAPAEAIDAVIGGNAMVHDLVAHEWLHLFRIADDGEVLRRLPEGGWQKAPEA